MSEVLHRLGEAGTRSARDLVESLRLRDGARGGRARVAAVMIASADGRATVHGRSVALGHPADRALLRELRTGADAILVGTRTLAAERYRALLDPEQRARRKALGRPEHPVVATISRRFDLPWDVPLFRERGTPVWVFTEARDAVAPAVPADVRVIEVRRLTLPAVLRLLADEGHRGVTCEGGPGLLRELVAQRCLDDLLLTVAPLLVAGDAPSILEGPELGEPPRLGLAAVHRAGDHVFLHYRQHP